MPGEEDVWGELLYMTEEELAEEGFSRGEILTIKDNISPRDLIDKFGMFYQLKMWSEAAGKKDKGLEGLTGPDFQYAFIIRLVDAQTQYSPFDYYGFLKERVEPEIQFRPVSEGMEDFIEDLRKKDASRERRGMEPKFETAIEMWEESLGRIKTWEEQRSGGAGE